MRLSSFLNKAFERKYGMYWNKYKNFVGMFILTVLIGPASYEGGPASKILSGVIQEWSKIRLTGKDNLIRIQFLVSTVK